MTALGQQVQQSGETELGNHENSIGRQNASPQAEISKNRKNLKPETRGHGAGRLHPRRFHRIVCHMPAQRDHLQAAAG